MAERKLSKRSQHHMCSIVAQRLAGLQPKKPHLEESSVYSSSSPSYDKNHPSSSPSQPEHELPSFPSHLEHEEPPLSPPSHLEHKEPPLSPPSHLEHEEPPLSPPSIYSPVGPVPISPRPEYGALDEVGDVDESSGEYCNSSDVSVSEESDELTDGLSEGDCSSENSERFPPQTSNYDSVGCGVPLYPESCISDDSFSTVFLSLADLFQPVRSFEVSIYHFCFLRLAEFHPLCICSKASMPTSKKIQLCSTFVASAHGQWSLALHVISGNV